MRGALLITLGLTACGLDPLRAEDVLARPPCPSTCGVGQACNELGQCFDAATLSGAVLDECTGAALSARVTIAGRSVCSGFEKVPYFLLTGLVPGGPYTLAVGKIGYRSYVGSRSLEVGSNTEPAISLTPTNGCQSMPAPTACTCTDSLCQL